MPAEPKCLYCGTTDKQTPLVNLSYQGTQIYICSQHLPVLIHEQHKLADKLAEIAKKAE